MAEAWLELARAGVFQAKRLEATLRPLAFQPAVGIRLSQTLQLALGPLVESGTRDMHVLLRLAASLVEAYGVFPEDARLSELSKQKGSGELLAAARALAATRPQGRGSSRASALELVEGLLDRAER